MLNVLNGGAHADNGLDVQEFMVAPVGAPSFAEGLRAGAEIYAALKSLLKGRGASTAVGDEGGFAPRLGSNVAALEAVAEAVGKAGYRLGTDVFLALDVAATELYADGTYRFEGKRLSAADLVGGLRRLGGPPSDLLHRRRAGRGRLGRLANDDGAAGAQDADRRRRPVRDTEGSARARHRRARRERGPRQAEPGRAPSPTRSRRSRPRYAAGYAAVMSHRSGETEDTTIADIAVATGCGQIKTGAPCRSERVAKYNRLLRIEAELGSAARYGRRPA